MMTILSVVLLTGCWDQRLLKDLKLVFTIGFDKGNNGEVVSHIAVRETKKLSIGGKPGEATIAVIKGEGVTLRDTRLSLDRRIPGEFSPSKTRAFMMGADLAKEDIYSILDIMYRDPKSPLGAMLMITDGKSEDIIKMKTVKETLLTEAITDILQTAENNTIVENHSIQTVCPIMFDPDVDFSLPVIKKIESNDIEVLGMGLFKEKAYTGVQLDEEQSMSLLMLMNKKGKIAEVNLLIHPEEENIRNRYLALRINKVKREINTTVLSPTDITVDITLHFSTSMVEYPRDGVVDKKEIKGLEEKAAKQLEDKAKEVIRLIQDAESDVLGIGQELRVHNYKDWKKIKWREVYPSVKINPSVSVKIIGTGIIN